MYTQCPDCEIAFKVTAGVLKQAAGKVRCGGCGNAFNALDFLSEEMPRQPQKREPDPALPELKPESNTADDGHPQSISAEQSAALLKTLDELAGSDIRIEDTGVEWRVLDEQEASAPAADDDSADLAEATKHVDEYLEESETPIDEFLTNTPEVIDSPEIFAESANGPAKTPVDELRFDDNTPLPDDFDLDDEASYAPQQEPIVADEMPPQDAPPDTDAAPEPADFALSEPDEWQDILGEFQELVDDVITPVSPEAATDDATTEADAALSTNEPLATDAQFALQAEALGIDDNGTAVRDDDEGPDSLLDDDDLDSDDLDLNDEFDSDDLDLDDELESDDDNVTEPDEDPDEPEEEARLDLLDAPLEPVVEPFIEAHTIEAELAELDDEDVADTVDDDTEETSGEHFVPPMTEEEQTVNMLIDQDLMALAMPDEDGFASTIIFSGEETEKQASESASGDSGSVDRSKDEAPGFETIIMEGEFVRSALDSEKLAADAAAAAELAELARAKEAARAAQPDKTNYAVLGGVILLVLLLLVQATHQYRDRLATVPAFSHSVGQLYRAVGQPIQPAWDITGWRFEATKGSAEGDDEKLTIYSRVGNKSDGPLPYPLIGISLTDRFEETIGSRILDPAEYLPSDLDPRKLVEPGNTFNAVITIETASEAATGFKLNVCYRLSGGQLRCAIDDFK